MNLFLTRWAAITAGTAIAAASALLAVPAQAQTPAAPAAGAAAQAGAPQPADAATQARIRKNLKDRLPQIDSVDEVNRTPMPGLFEVRIDTDIVYTDAEANFLIYGNLVDTRAKRNLTEERQAKLNALDFDALPVADAFTVVRGNGKRKVAVFQDPNCGYCKRFERDLQKVDNITVHMFLLPILGKDSTDKAGHIWCAKDRVKAWQDWMLRNQTPAAASCDTAALKRNVDFGRKHRINGTPTLVFADGTRVPGAINAEQLEKMLADASR
ncbi:MAG: DsbC family protein [Burkholderiaceae bacterium]